MVFAAAPGLDRRQAENRGEGRTFLWHEQGNYLKVINKILIPGRLSPTGFRTCPDGYVHKSSFPLTGNRGILPALNDHFCTFALGRYDYEVE